MIWFFICFVLISSIKIYAQDIITTKDAQQISANIIEVSNKEIKYKKANNSDGPTFVINHSDVKSILYESGEYSSFDNNQQYNNDYDDETRPFIKGARFNCYPEWSLYAGDDLGLCFSWTFGVRIFDYAFVGVGIGLEYFNDKETTFQEDYTNLSDNNYPLFYMFKNDWVSLPITFNARGYIPINRNVQPFIELSLGKSMGLTEPEDLKPTKFMIGMGFDFARFSLGFGYAQYTAEQNYSVLDYNYYTQKVKSQNFYIKLGVKIGKRG